MSSWHDKKVLVTGADGFLGSHLVEALVAEGARVTAFCFYNSFSSLGWLDHVAPMVRDALSVELGDIRDAEFTARCCRDMDTVFHLAALVSIPHSYQAPRAFIDTNLTGTLNVLEGVRRAGCRRLVHTSTSEVYGTPTTVPITEDHRLQGQSPYSASKIAADQLGFAYHKSFDVPVVTLRPFNTYGPRQSTRAVIPTILTQLLAGQREVQLGALEPKRDFTYVADTVRGFLAVGATEGLEGDTIQLGTGNAVSIGMLFEIACEVLGKKAVAVCDPTRVRPAPSEVMVLESDPGHARARTGWTPHVALAKGLAATAEWLAANRHLYRAGYHV